MDQVQTDGFDSEDEIDEFFQSLMDQVSDGYNNLVHSGMGKVDEYVSYLSGLGNTTSSNDTSSNINYDQNNTNIDSSEVDEDISYSKYENAIEEAIESGSQSFMSFLDDIDEDRGEILDEVDDLYEENTQQIYDLKEDLLEDLEDAMDNVQELIDESFEHMEDNEYVRYIKKAFIQAQQDLDDSYLFERSTLALDDYPDHWIPNDQDPEQFQYSKPLMQALEDIYNVHNIQSYTDEKSDKRQDIYKQKFLAMLPSRLKKEQTQQE